MKVGILTLPLWHNYGGILQAYALTMSLKRLGHHAIFLDVQRDTLSKTQQFMRNLRRWIKNQLLQIEGLYYPNQTELEYISKKTRNFVDKNIQPSSGSMPLSQLANFSHNLDAIIVGSDQVWRPEYCPNIDFYFLGFADDKIRKISYAASLGTSDWRFNDENTMHGKKLLKQFHSVSVREESAVNLIQDKMNINAVQSCDPTLLLTVEDYLNVAGMSKLSSGGKGIFCYVLDPEEPRMQGLKNIGFQLNCEMFYNMPKTFDKHFAKVPKKYVFPTVESWIGCFQQSDFVITDSFHGCVFSIIFNKPFIAIANTDRGYTRFDSLLGIFNLKERLFERVVDINLDILKKKIDWNTVNKIRMEQKEQGLNFLKKSLLEI